MIACARQQNLSSSGGGGGPPCTAVGNASLSTTYVSLDSDGTQRFSSEFRFASVDNMIAFENAPFLSAPRYGGFCAWAISQSQNRSSGQPRWGRDRLGPPVDLLRSWRLIPGGDAAPPALYLFGSEEGAARFVAGLPASRARADKTWRQWWGEHGTVPPYAVHGGPFNSMCFTAKAGGGAPSRDCAKDPQPLPPPM